MSKYEIKEKVFIEAEILSKNRNDSYNIKTRDGYILGEIKEVCLTPFTQNNITADEQTQKLWNIVKGIFLDVEEGGFTFKDVREAFGLGGKGYEIIQYYTPKQLIDTWEDYKKLKDIQIGDIITSDFCEEKALVIDIAEEMFTVYTEKSNLETWNKTVCKKTGRTIDMRSIAEQIGE